MPLVTKNFSDIITFTRASTATYFDATGTLQSAAIDAPRLDYNPATLAAQGFLIEEARTNSIRNNTMVGAVAGTPGTLPQVSGVTSWNVSGLGTLNQQVVAVSTINGINYIDLRFSGTTSTTQLSIRSETGGTGAIAAANGQTWSMSLWSAMVAGSLTNILGSGYGTLAFDGAGAFIGAPFSSGVLNTTSTLTRTERSGTIAIAGTAFIQPQIYVFFNSGAAIDITLRIGLPQLENNNISTGVASATVASGGSGYAVGDVLQIVGGTGSTAARLTVATLSGSAVATVTVSTAGSYTTFPSPQPVSVTAITGTGSSATFNIVPQTQTGFATSVIPTTTTALTRSADVASVNTLSPWYNATEGTLFAEGLSFAPTSSFARVASIEDVSFNTVISIQRNGTDSRGFGDLASTIITSGMPQNTVFKAALAAKVNDFALSANGSAPNVDTTTNPLPIAVKMGIGQTTAATSFINGYLRRITYYPRRLSNAELQTITA